MGYIAVSIIQSPIVLRKLRFNYAKCTHSSNYKAVGHRQKTQIQLTLEGCKVRAAFLVSRK